MELASDAEVVGGNREIGRMRARDHTAGPAEARRIPDASHMRVAEEEDTLVGHGASYTH